MDLDLIYPQKLSVSSNTLHQKTWTVLHYLHQFLIHFRFYFSFYPLFFLIVLVGGAIPGSVFRTSFLVVFKGHVVPAIQFRVPACNACVSDFGSSSQPPITSFEVVSGALALNIDGAQVLLLAFVLMSDPWRCLGVRSNLSPPWPAP